MQAFPPVSPGERGDGHGGSSDPMAGTMQPSGVVSNGLGSGMSSDLGSGSLVATGTTCAATGGDTSAI